MPKQIDVNERKILIAEALWRIILKKGIEGASVRNVAEEAGLSLGAMRYYFQTQHEMMEFADKLASERIIKRVDEIFTADKDPEEKILQVLVEMLPFDTKITKETKVRIAFRMRSVYGGKTGSAGGDGVYFAVKNAMSNLSLLNRLKRELDISLETERLFALLNGLAFDCLLRPTEVTKDKAREILTYHMKSICKEPLE